MDSRQLAIDAIRVLSMDAVQAANSGHPGTPMALAPAGYTLFRHHLRHNPANPDWVDRDRFVLSIGHASMLLYSLLHLSGYELALDDIKDFRQWGSPTAGHPEYGHVPGVETTTGPLGQGVANSVGMAMAERWLSHRFNRPGHPIIDHFTYAFCSDGDVMEGVSHEAAELAGHHKLGKLIWVFDDNNITIEGDTDLATSVDHAARMASYGWHVLTVEDGNDLEALDQALEAARSETERPTFIVLRTVIGFGSPNMAGSEATHGAPLGADEVEASKKNLGYPSLEPFYVPDEAREHWAAAPTRGAELEADWQRRYGAYQAEFPELSQELERMLDGRLPQGWDDNVPDLSRVDGPDATRGWSGRVLQGLAAGIPELLGGSADLGGSNKTDIKGGGSFLPGSPDGRIIHFGVREHAMGSLMNGMALHGGPRPFGGTFLIFSDYMRPAIRLAALMGLPTTYVFTHDSIGLGEDGPTHQPVEQLAALRSIPNLVDLRPGDAAETEIAWRVIMEQTQRPSFLSLTRQKVAVLDRSGELASAEGLRKGGYVLADAEAGELQVILLASGSELSLAVEARGVLEDEGIGTRVVSLPSWRLFQDQPMDYQNQVLPPTLTARVSVEAGSTFGWSRWLGHEGRAVGIDHFGASAPAERLYQEFGITADAVVHQARSLALDSD